MSKSILIIEDEETLRDSLGRIFTKDGFAVDTADSAKKGLEFLETSLYDVIISDIILPGMDGIELLKQVRKVSPDQIFIMMTAYASLETAVTALRSGAYDYIMKPVMHEEIKQVVKNALIQKSLLSENILLKREIGKTYDFTNIIGETTALKGIMEEVKKVADTKSSILLLGETGTGKELFARAVHNNSSRRDKPFVPINCSAIPESLLENELFGHLKGAFTGAVMSKKGLFEEADGGTIFLDEIGDISTSFQVKLLRVVDDQLIRPLGGTKSAKVDVRLITATNTDLEKAVTDGAFREDLYYRINTITLKMPPLRERKEDIPLLVKDFVEKYSRQFGKKISEISPDALAAIKNYSWPGNVRELQNVIERAILLAADSTIRIENLPEMMRDMRSFQHASIETGLSIEDYTKRFIMRFQALYNEQQIADMLGITRKSLWEKRKRWGIIKD
ncbi:MAG: sigma-54 dependent transcriptional regulator [Thermodesulfovibrionia bacterium]|nr:sigma-54 dependent transcriptional regulator [Thermodesulfovibrionia bacterium]